VIVNLSAIREESGLLVETTKRRPVFPWAKALLRQWDNLSDQLGLVESFRSPQPILSKRARQTVIQLVHSSQIKIRASMHRGKICAP
jgi:hypothetical protein